MPLSDDQFGWAGLTLGAGTKYSVQYCRGHRGQPDIESNDTPKVEGSGSFAGFDTQSGRTIEMGLTIKGTSAADYESLLAALETAMAPMTDTTGAWTWKDPTVSTKTVQARPRKMSAPQVPTRKKFWAQVELQWFCPDVTVS